MKTIPVTQFLRPHGQQVQMDTDVQDDEYEKYLELTRLGARLTVEELMNGLVSQCIEHPDVGDFDIQLSQNDQSVVSQRREILLRFSPRLFDRWFEAMTADGNPGEEAE